MDVNKKQKNSEKQKQRKSQEKKGARCILCPSDFVLQQRRNSLCFSFFFLGKSTGISSFGILAQNR
jgi:hypothetical protein